MGAFYETKICFTEAIGYTRPLSWEEWMKIRSDHKAAALFVQFYADIYGAWNKTKSFYTLEEDGVSTMMQYLQKNVSLIENCENKFRPAYIYKVAFNCLYCICHDIKRDRERWENETSNITSCGEDELDLFDTVVSHDDNEYIDSIDRTKLWAIVSSMGPEALKVVDHLINGSKLGKTPKRSASYKFDPLRDIEVSVERMHEIVDQLKVSLAAFKELYY